MKWFLLSLLLTTLLLPTPPLYAGPAPTKEAIPSFDPKDPTLSPDAIKGFEHISNSLKPGERKVVRLNSTVTGPITRTVTGTATGAGFRGDAKDLKGEFNPESPSMDLSNFLGAGGGLRSSFDFKGWTLNTKPWENPFFWIGIVLFAAAGACVSLKAYLPWLPTSSPYFFGVAGIVCEATAFYPAAWLWALVLLALGGTAYLLWVLYGAGVTKTLLVQTAQGLDSSGLDPDARAKALAAISTKRSKADAAKMEKVLKKAKVGKYASTT